jgi:hypothetical protein
MNVIRGTLALEVLGIIFGGQCWTNRRLRIPSPRTNLPPILPLSVGLWGGRVSDIVFNYLYIFSNVALKNFDE